MQRKPLVPHVAGQIQRKKEDDAMEAITRELSASNQYVNEEVSSSYVYPNGYTVKGITKQFATLRQLFPELKNVTFDASIAARPLPPNAEDTVRFWAGFMGEFSCIEQAIQPVF